MSKPYSKISTVGLRCVQFLNVTAGQHRPSGSVHPIFVGSQIQISRQGLINVYWTEAPDSATLVVIRILIMTFSEEIVSLRQTVTAHRQSSTHSSHSYTLIKYLPRFIPICLKIPATVKKRSTFQSRPLNSYRISSSY